MPVEDSDHGARELLCIGPEIEILSPASLRQRIAQMAREIAAFHEGEFQ
jgi:predicted DNA-binding transcriptional regulator YafY